MQQGKVFSCQVIHFSAKNIQNKIIQIILLTFSPRFWSTLLLNSDLCEGEVEGQRLILLSFFPQIKEIWRREMGENVSFQVSLCILSYILFLCLFWVGITVGEKEEGECKMKKEQRFLPFIFSFPTLHPHPHPPPFFFCKEGKSVDEIVLKIHKFKHWKVTSSLRLILGNTKLKCWILIDWKCFVELNTYKKLHHNKTHTPMVGDFNW